MQYTPLLEPRTQIGVIQLKDNATSSYRYSTELHSFFKNPSIKGIVIKIDCPDGSPGTCQTIFHEIRQLKKEYPKPIVSLVENYCLAGGYLIASATDHIIAPECAIIGNINADFIKTEQYEAITSYNSKPEEEKTTLLALHNDAYQQIIRQIAAARKLSLTSITNWADGKIFTGHQAIHYGLVNEIGSMYTVIKYMKEKALIENEIEWVE